MYKLITLLALIFLHGCASTPNPFSTDKTFAGISPPFAHRHDDDGRVKTKMKGVLTDDILDAEAKPFVDYYAALKQAAGTSGTLAERKANIDDYVLKGITVVNISCSRWFNSLSEAQSRFAFTQNNQNVIQNLGTTLLGLGKANSLVVGAFGAAFAGLNGIENNFSQSFLLAPNANKVKEHIFTALDQQAAQLRKAPETGKISLQPTTFTEAYLALERYADICTQQTSKEIVNSALDQTKTTLATDQGNRVITTSTESSKDAALIKLTSDVLSLQTDTAKAIGKLQVAMDSAATANDYSAIKNQLTDIAKKLAPVSPPIEPKPPAPAPAPTIPPVPGR